MIVRNGKLFMDGKFVEGPDVRVFNGRIHEIGYHLEAGLYEQITDVKGDIILPGFVDVHIHAFRKHDTIKRPDLGLIQQSIRDTIMDVDGIADCTVTLLSYDIADRKISFRYSATTEEGAIIVEEVELDG